MRRSILRSMNRSKPCRNCHRIRTDNGSFGCNRGRRSLRSTFRKRFSRRRKRTIVGQDDETDWVLDQWEAVLQDLRGDYQTLVGRVDWASKLWLLETFREAEQTTWADPALKSLDLEYHNLHQGKGLYYGLMEEGRVPRLTTDKAIALSMDHPPRNTRAFGRGELVRHLLACGPPDEPADPKPEERFSPSYVINWSIFQLRGHAPFPMPDPFKTYVQEVRAHLQTA